MDDAELVRAARSGDASAFTAIFDRHAARVHDLALAMLRDRNAALEVVESTFLEASLRLHGLEEDHRLPVWLLAITRRNGALRAGPTAGVDRQPALPNDDPERVHLASLVWEAVADLPLRDRTLLDLELRQGLDGHDLADAVGVTLPQAQDLQTRMRDRIEKGLSGYLIARTADGRCPDLTKVLKGWDGRFTPKDSRRIADHVDGCRVCNQTRFALPSPFALYAAALPAPFPAAVRSRVIDRVVLTAAPNAGTGMPPAAVPASQAVAAPYQAPMPATAAYQSPMPPPTPYDAAGSPFQGPEPAPVPAPYPEAQPPTGPYPAAPHPEAAPSPVPFPEALPPPPAPPYPEAPSPYPLPEAPPATPAGEPAPAPPFEAEAPAEPVGYGYQDPAPAAEPVGYGYQDPAPTAYPEPDAPAGADPYPQQEAVPRPAPFPQAAEPYPQAAESFPQAPAPYPLPEAQPEATPVTGATDAEPGPGAYPQDPAAPHPAAAAPADGTAPAPAPPGADAPDSASDGTLEDNPPPPPRPQELQ